MLLACAIGAGGGARAQERPAEDESIRALLTAIEQSVRSGDGAAYLALHTADASHERAAEFMTSELLLDVTRSVVQERDRQPLPGTLPGKGYRLLVDAFTEFTG